MRACAEALTAVFGAACWPVVLAAVGGILAVCIADRTAHRAKLLTVLAAELVLFRQCVPLVAFAVYVCLWHPPEHLIATSARAGEPSRMTVTRVRANLRAGVVPWIIALLGAGLAALLSHRTLATEAAQIFIVLSALTVPHMGGSASCAGFTYRHNGWLPDAPAPDEPGGQVSSACMRSPARDGLKRHARSRGVHTPSGTLDHVAYPQPWKAKHGASRFIGCSGVRVVRFRAPC